MFVLTPGSFLDIHSLKRNLAKHLWQPCLTLFLMTVISTNISAQPSVKDIRGAAAVVPLSSEPPPKLFIDPPLPDQLALGRVVVQYRTENLHIVPVFGPAALAVSPRIGHIHVTVDDAPWHWADASGEPLIINGMIAGPHKILIELADPTHKIIEAKSISFIVPEKKPAAPAKNQ
jgi:hypothetical protein